ncbi:MAG: Holliday junction resolvase RuvX [Rickettsiales bacterium]|nr:Holliday junction resolvase RuvX [Rickettsiales bacterium]
MPIIKNVKLILKDKYKNQKALAIDYGEKRFGTAISDQLGIIANGFKIIERNNIESDLKHLLTIIQNEQINFIVFGLPKSLDNKATITSQRAKSFANLLNQNLAIDIFFWDERFSSRSAEKIAYQSKEFKNKHDDNIAAAIILQNFLDFKNKG